MKTRFNFTTTCSTFVRSQPDAPLGRRRIHADVCAVRPLRTDLGDAHRIRGQPDSRSDTRRIPVRPRTFIDSSSGVDLFVCEATLLEAGPEPFETRGHLTAAEAGILAAEIGCGNLMLTHLWEELDRNRVRSDAEAHLCGTDRDRAAGIGRKSLVVLVLASEPTDVRAFD